MGIVSSTFASLAIQIAWNCQRLLDPRYRCAENKSKICELSPPAKAVESTKPTAPVNTPQLTSRLENNNSIHQQNRNRRAHQHRYRKRPTSFDTSLIVHSGTKNYPNGVAIHATRVVNSTSSPQQRRPARFWDLTSSSGCSSNSGSDLDSDFEAELRTQETGELEEDAQARKRFGMSAAEETAFRLTVGRGHFSRSKKDRFLNHLRLEKRLNDLNKEFFEVACLAHCRSLQRRHSGDLHRID